MYLSENSAFERHYRIAELARMWGLGRETVRKLVKDDPGVIKIRMGRKKAHTVYSVPGIRCKPHTHPFDKCFLSTWNVQQGFPCSAEAGV